jgi:drug/metabolite transporter (DMT)-like permease
MTAEAKRAGARPGVELAVGAMLLSAACWGLATVMTKAALGGMPPFTLLVIQLAASVSFLWSAVAATRSLPCRHGRALRAAATGLLEPGLAYGAGVPGLALTTAANASIIGATEPALVILVAWLLLRARPDPGLLVALLVAMVGVALVIGSDLHGLGHGDPCGDALVLLGTLFAAIYVVASSRLVTHIAPLPLAALQQSVGLGAALTLLASALTLGVEQLPSAVTPGLGLLAVASGVVQYALSFWFYLFGVKVLPVGVAGLFLTLIPVFGVGGATIFLGERVTPLQALGAVLILATLAVIAWRTRISARSGEST